MAAELDAAFFTCAATEGTAFTTAETDIEAQVEALIQTLETVKNDYVRGVPRNLIRLVLDPVFYGKIRTYLDKNTHNANVDTAAEDFALFHGVRVYSSINLPVTSETVETTKTTTYHMIAIIEGAIAQPVVIYPYGEPEKIPLSNDYGVSMFFDYGTKALTPDLIFHYSTSVTSD